MKTVLILLGICFLSSQVHAQNWLTTGNNDLTNSSFLGSTDLKGLIFRTNNIERGRILNTGTWRFGTSIDFAKIDSAGTFTFSGNGGYKVAGNKYVFQYLDNPNYGFFFTAAPLQYEFRNGSANPVFTVNANTGNGTFNGSLRIGAYTLPAGDGTNGQVLKTNGTGVLTWSSDNSSQWTTNGSSLFYNSGYVGVGISNPFYKLDVNGDINFGSTSSLLQGGVRVFYSDFARSGTYGGVAGNLSSTGMANTFFGAAAGVLTTTGGENTFLGSGAGTHNTTGSQNTYIGEVAGSSNVDGNDNTMIGFAAGQGLGTTTSANTFIGSLSGQKITTGSFNSSLGFNSLQRLTKGSSNVAVGQWALGRSQQNSYNVAIGDSALYTYNDGTFIDYMVAIGSKALALNTIGYVNTAVGGHALFANSTGHNNTSTGGLSLSANTTGNYNTAIGANALLSNTTGSSVTAVGANTNVNSGDAAYSNSSAFGYGTVISASNQVRIGNTQVTSIGGFANWTNFSDGRFKKNIKENVKGLDFINLLKPITYTLDIEGVSAFLQKDIPVLNTRENNDKQNTDKQQISDKEKIVYSGFVAQEVETAAKKTGYDFSGVDVAKNEKDVYGLRYSDFVVPLVKAVQELSGENDELKKENSDIRKELDELKLIVSKIQNTTVTDKSTSQSTELRLTAKLEQNIPNPFSNTTAINYYLPVNKGNAYINFYSSVGAVLKSVKLSTAGKGTINVKASELPSGSYQYSLVVDGKVIDTKQMMQMK